MKNGIKNSCKAQGLVEYALLLLLVAVVTGLGLSAAGVSIPEVYNQVITGFQGGGENGAGGEQPACLPLAQAGEDWTAFYDKFWRGGITPEGLGYQVCPLCGGLVPGFTGSDYQIDLSGVQVGNVRPTWNGYGVAFRSEYGKQGLNGYTFEIERVNKNAPVQIYFSKWVNGKQIKPPLSVQNLPADFDWNTPPDISVKAEGDTFTAYVGGKPVLQASDQTFTEGGAGVISNYGTQLSFSDFQVGALACTEAQ